MHGIKHKKYLDTIHGYKVTMAESTYIYIR
jgi:hypothetical protein